MDNGRFSDHVLATSLSRAKEPNVKGPYNIKPSCLFTFYMNEMLLNCVNTVYIYICIYTIYSHAGCLNEWLLLVLHKLYDCGPTFNTKQSNFVVANEGKAAWSRVVQP